MNEAQRDLAIEQIAAIKRDLQLGRTLQIEHPEIADKYRNGQFIHLIAEEINIQKEYETSYDSAVNSARNALVGHRGGFGAESYQGLLSLEESASLGKEHNRAAGLARYEEKSGVHGRTPKEMSEDGREGGKIGGKIGGKNAYENGRGIFSWTEEQKKEVGQKTYDEPKGIHTQTEKEQRDASMAGVIARGFKHRSNDEKRDAYELSLLPEYKKGSLTNREKVARALNIKWHKGENVRTVEAVNHMIKDVKKSLKEIVNCTII